MQTGESQSQRFGGLVSVGYAWNYAVDPPGILSVSLETAKPPMTSQPSTYDSDYIYTVTALNPGNARIRYYLQRPWEKGKPPLREVVMDVVVLEP